MAVAGEFRCLDSAIASVIEDVERAFILKEEQGTVIKAFVDSIESRGIFFPGVVNLFLLKCRRFRSEDQETRAVS